MTYTTASHLGGDHNVLASLFSGGVTSPASIHNQLATYSRFVCLWYQIKAEMFQKNLSKIALYYFFFQLTSIQFKKIQQVKWLSQAIKYV